MNTDSVLDRFRRAGALLEGHVRLTSGLYLQQRIDVPFHALATIALRTYDAAVCPMCAEGKPVVERGSRVV